MKKSILILSTTLIGMSLMAYGLINEDKFELSLSNAQCAKIEAPLLELVALNDKEGLVDFFYDFGSRFNPISKKALTEARSVSDFLSEDEMTRYSGVRSTAVIIIENDRPTDKLIEGTSALLNSQQLEFIESLDYSSHFLMQAEFYCKNPDAELRGENIFRPHMTVVPEKQATYPGGKDELLAYFRENNEKNIYNLDEKKLQPAKLYFTVAKDGIVKDVYLDRTSGYANIDEAMIELAKKIPGKWQPAENANGEKMDQELVISFGMVGC